MYQIIQNPLGGNPTIYRFNDKTSFGCNLDNTDYANFKKDLADGAELQDAEGNVIDGIAYLKELV